MSVPRSSAPGSSARSTSRPCGASACRSGAWSRRHPSWAPRGRPSSGLPRAYASLAELLADDAVRGGPRHLAQRAPSRPGQADPRRRPPRHLREAAGHDVGRVGRAGRAGGRAAGWSNAVNFNLRFYPLNQHLAGFIAEGGLGDVRLVTGPLLPGLAALRHRLELAPGEGQGRRPAGGGRHRLALARPDQLPHRAPRGGGHGRPDDVHPGAASAGRPGRDLLDRAGRRDGARRRSTPRTWPRSCCASTAAPAAAAPSPS